MKGRILELGVISGDNGNQYSFVLEDVKNLDNYNKNNLSNLMVDFEVDGKQAINIYIITSNTIGYSSDILSNIKDNISNNNMTKIRYIAIASIILGFFINVPYLGIAFAIASLILYFMAILYIKNLSQSKTILRNFISTIILAFVAMFFAVSITTTHLNNLNSFIVIILSLILIVLCVLLIIVSLRFIRELSYVTNKRMFLWVYYLGVVSGLLTSNKFLPSEIVIFGFIISIVAFIANIYVWTAVKEIRQTTKYKNMRWI